MKASNTGEDDLFGATVALSSDGNTLAVGAPGEDSQIGLTQGDNGAARSGAVYVYSRDTTSTSTSFGNWSDAAYIKASRSTPTSIDAGDLFGSSLALSADGSTLAVGAIGERSNATGINGDRSDNSNSRAGAVYVFNRQGNGDWRDEPTYLKASNNNQGSNNSGRFGASVALSGNGDTLVIGASGEGGAAIGLDGDQADQSMLQSGAAYTFIRDGGNWSQQAYVKASDTGADFHESFGIAVALSADDGVLVVGAARQENVLASISANAGTVYVY